MNKIDRKKQEEMERLQEKIDKIVSYLQKSCWRGVLLNNVYSCTNDKFLVELRLDKTIFLTLIQSNDSTKRLIFSSNQVDLGGNYNHFVYARLFENSPECYIVNNMNSLLATLESDYRKAQAAQNKLKLSTTEEIYNTLFESYWA